MKYGLDYCPFHRAQEGKKERRRVTKTRLGLIRKTGRTRSFEEKRGERQCSFRR